MAIAPQDRQIMTHMRHVHPIVSTRASRDAYAPQAGFGDCALHGAVGADLFTNSSTIGSAAAARLRTPIAI